MIPSQFGPQAYAVMRMVFGFLFTFHGLQKLFGLFGGNVVSFPEPRFFAGVLEVIGGPLVMLGLFTQPVAFLLSGEMAVAYFMAHFPRGMVPIANGGEPAVLFCFAFLYFSTRGAGIWSLDSLRKRS